MKKNKDKAPYCPHNLQAGQHCAIFTSYDSYIDVLKEMDNFKDITGIEVYDQGPCESGIDTWYIITQKRAL